MYDRRYQVEMKGMDATMRDELKVVAMDMWPAYENAVRRHTKAKIAYDRFHVMSHISHAVDLVRRKEHRELLAGGDGRLKGTRYLWLTRLDRLEGQGLDRFQRLRQSSLRTARTWWRREIADHLWGFSDCASAAQAWKRWATDTLRSRQEPMKKVARMVLRHLNGIAVAASTGVTNAHAESLNAKIQKVMRMTHGYRNMESFKNAIYFHCGGLSMYLETPSTTTT